MAHGDYKCCAICDVKQEYVGFNDSFKDDICPSCRLKTGIATVGELIKKINSFKNKNELRKWLKEIGWEECFYQNNVDDLILFKLKGKIPKKFKSAIEFLKAVDAL